MTPFIKEVSLVLLKSFVLGVNLNFCFNELFNKVKVLCTYVCQEDEMIYNFISNEIDKTRIISDLENDTKNIFSQYDAAPM